LYTIDDDGPNLEIHDDVASFLSSKSDPSTADPPEGHDPNHPHFWKTICVTF
jgi:hypothetical protein